MIVVLIGGQCHDASVFDQVIGQVPQGYGLEAAALDKSYASASIRDKLKEKEIIPVIPPRINRKEQMNYDKKTYKSRNKVKIFFNKTKQFRRIATGMKNLHRPSWLLYA